MVPITSNVSLHHFAAHHVTIITPITLEERFLLPRNWGVISLVESFFDQVNYRLAFLLRQYCFWEASIQKTCHSHWVMRLLVIGWEESA